MQSHKLNGIEPVAPAPSSPEKKFVVLFDTPSESNGLRVKKDEVIEVLSETDPNWFWVRLQRNGVTQEGYVPASYISELEDLHVHK